VDLTTKLKEITAKIDGVSAGGGSGTASIAAATWYPSTAGGNDRISATKPSYTIQFAFTTPDDGKVFTQQDINKFNEGKPSDGWGWTAEISTKQERFGVTAGATPVADYSVSGPTLGVAPPSKYDAEADLTRSLSLADQRKIVAAAKAGKNLKIYGDLIEAVPEVEETQDTLNWVGGVDQGASGAQFALKFGRNLGKDIYILPKSFDPGDKVASFEVAATEIYDIELTQWISRSVGIQTLSGSSSVVKNITIEIIDDSTVSWSTSIALAALRIAVKTGYTPTAAELSQYDYNKDGKIDTKDALAILKASL